MDTLTAGHVALGSGFYDQGRLHEITACAEAAACSAWRRW
jgi:hypothetical protein